MRGQRLRDGQSGGEHGTVSITPAGRYKDGLNHGGLAMKSIDTYTRLSPRYAPYGIVRI